jgi:group I intron endonuclease
VKTVQIYALIDNEGNVRYVGKTTSTLKKRLNQHIAGAKRGNRGHKDNWIRSQISSNRPINIKSLELVNQDDWQSKEIYWISYFKNLTNATLGGEGLNGYVFTDEHKNKISQSNKGHIVSKDTRFKLSIANKGKKISDETKIKISEYHSGKSKTIEHRNKLRVAHIGKKHSKESLLKMSKSHVGFKHSAFSRAKMSNSRKGLIKSDSHIQKIAETKYKPIDQLTLDGNFIKTFSSIKAAANEMGIFHHAITVCLQNSHRTAKGFKWRYANENIN